MDAWSDLRSEIRTVLKEPDTSVGNWTDARLLFRANKIQAAICSGILCMETSEVINLTADTTNYTPTSQWLATRVVYYLGAPLMKTTEEEIAHKMRVGAIKERSLKSTADKPYCWFPSAGQLVIFPALPVAKAGAVKASFWIRPTDLSGDSDTPFDGKEYMEPFTDLILFGVTAWCLSEAGESRGGEREMFKMWYRERLGELRAFINVRYGLPVHATPEKVSKTGVVQSGTIGGPAQPMGGGNA